jgi:hypothetical protein
MRYSNQGWFREQASFLRHQFLQDGDLPFSNVLSEERKTSIPSGYGNAAAFTFLTDPRSRCLNRDAAHIVEAVSPW